MSENSKKEDENKVILIASKLEQAIHYGRIKTKEDFIKRIEEVAKKFNFLPVLVAEIIDKIIDPN